MKLTPLYVVAEKQTGGGQILGKWTSFVFIIFTLLSVSADDRETADFLSLYGLEQEVGLYPELLAMYIPMDPNMAVALYFGPYQQSINAIIEKHTAGFDYFPDDISRSVL